MMIYKLDDYSKDEQLKKKNVTSTMQLLIDTGLNAFAAKLLSESYEKIPDELKSKLPEKLSFILGDTQITLSKAHEKEKD